MTLRVLTMALVLLLVSGCWNGGNTNVRLGDVSLGQQLLDLKTALEGGVITPQEFEDTKASLLALNTLCGKTQSESNSEPDSDSGLKWF